MNDAILAAIREVSAIPAERRLWSLATIAEYAELSVSHVAQVIAARPSRNRPSAAGPASPCPAAPGRAGCARAG